MKSSKQMAAVAMVAAMMALGMVSSANAANQIRNTVFLPSSPTVRVSDTGGSSGPARPSLYGDDALDIRVRNQNLPGTVKYDFIKTIRWFMQARYGR